MARRPRASKARSSKSVAATKAATIKKAEAVKPKINLKQLEDIEAPRFYVTAMNIHGSGNDFTILFQQAQPLRDKSGGFSSVAKLAITTIVSMSPQTAKDLLTALGSSVSQFEEEYGKIDTPYLRRLTVDGKKSTGR